MIKWSTIKRLHILFWCDDFDFYCTHCLTARNANECLIICFNYFHLLFYFPFSEFLPKYYSSLFTIIYGFTHFPEFYSTQIESFKLLQRKIRQLSLLCLL
uniref:Uncharacterized protein n=1 Tax=Brugia malayi TaxID=6279 RepID=A0A5S6PD81_BRUMA